MERDLNEYNEWKNTLDPEARPRGGMTSPTWLEIQVASASASLAKIPEKYRPRLKRPDRHEPDGRECSWWKAKDDEFYCSTHDSYMPLKEN